MRLASLSPNHNAALRRWIWFVKCTSVILSLNAIVTNSLFTVQIEPVEIILIYSTISAAFYELFSAVADLSFDVLMIHLVTKNDTKHASQIGIRRKFGAMFLGLLIIDCAMVGLFLTSVLSPSMTDLESEVNFVSNIMIASHILISCNLIQLFAVKVVKKKKKLPKKQVVENNKVESTPTWNSFFSPFPAQIPFDGNVMEGSLSGSFSASESIRS